MKSLRLTPEAFDRLQARYGVRGAAIQNGTRKGLEARKSPPDQPEGPNGVIRKVTGRISVEKPEQKLGEGPRKRSERIKTPYADRWAMELERQIALVGLPKPELEYLFAREVGRKFRADLCWPDRRLILEIDGGAHCVRIRQKQTILRAQIAQELGYKVITVLPSQVRNGEALRLLERELMGSTATLA